MVRFCSHPVLRSYRCTLPRTRTATTHLLTTSPSCSLLFSTLAIINRYPQTKHQPMVFTRPTNQSSINRQSPSSINLLSLQGPRPPSPALPVSHAPVSATAIASLEWGERGPESRIHQSSTSQALLFRRKRLYDGTTNISPSLAAAAAVAAGQPRACLCLSLLHHPNLSHVYHRHCLSAGLKTPILPFVHDIPSHPVRDLIKRQWPPLQLPAQCSNSTNNNLLSARHVNGSLRCPPA